VHILASHVVEEEEEEEEEEGFIWNVKRAKEIMSFGCSRNGWCLARLRRHFVSQLEHISVPAPSSLPPIQNSRKVQRHPVAHGVIAFSNLLCLTFSCPRSKCSSGGWSCCTRLAIRVLFLSGKATQA
jgi:hypothetical protein